MWGASEKVMPSRLVLEGTRLPTSGSRVCLPACLQLPPPLPLFDWNCRASLAAFGFAADPQPDRLNSSAYGNDMV